MGSNHATARLDTMINSNCVVVFSRAGCGPCQVVKRMFKEADIPFLLVDLEQNPFIKAQDVMNKTGCRTVSDYYQSARACK